MKSSSSIGLRLSSVVARLGLTPFMAVTDARILDLSHNSATFRWKDRSNQNRSETLTLPGIEFVRRYLRHVLPRGLRSVRYYGFCHPAAKANRMRAQFQSGIPVPFGATASANTSDADSCQTCPKCGSPMTFIRRIQSPWRKRGPPLSQNPNSSRQYYDDTLVIRDHDPSAGWRKVNMVDSRHSILASGGSPDTKRNKRGNLQVLSDVACHN
ncbi:MAG: transposase [Verrucomicrobia bacterium]|nr:transposase [Verrucomicrobiota bacterium]